jgi:hypothetical protein
MKEGFQRMSKGTNPAVSTRRTGGTLEEIDQLFFWLYLLYAKSKYRQTDSYIDILGLSRILLSVPCCWDTRADVILKICLISPCAARSSCMPIILNLIPIHCSYPSRRLPPKSVLTLYENDEKSGQSSASSKLEVLLTASILAEARSMA